MRPYHVLRKSTVTVVRPAAELARGEAVGAATNGEERETFDVLIPVGIFEASGDPQACKAACTADLAAGRLEGVTAPEYIAVSESGYHEHTLVVNTAPQIGYAK